MITIEEDDSVINDGVATMIIVAVKKADGKVIRVPYSAYKTISELISDVNAKLGNAPLVVREPETLDIRPGSIPKQIRELAGDSDGTIKKEDLVKCVKLLPRDKDAPIDMEVGGIYRVLALPTGKVPYYEVIDDTDYHKADIPRRVAAYPEEIVFFAKRKTPIQKEIGRFEQIMACELCQKKIVGHKMEDEKYHAVCQECNHETVVQNMLQTV